MRALIFAAGRGERMRPLTDHLPKPLLAVGGKPLIVHHLEKLAAIGVREVVINTAHLAECFPAQLGDGGQWGLRLHYAHEGAQALETGGGMLNALRWLGDAPFIALNGDVWTDLDFARLAAEPAGLAHLVLVDNPAHNPAGDFVLRTDGQVDEDGGARLTFAGLGSYRPQLLDDWQHILGNAPGTADTPPRFKLAPLLRAAMRQGQITGEHHPGTWADIGTPERLAEINQQAITVPSRIIL